MKKYCKFHVFITICYFGLYLAVGISLLVMQPFGNPPDEYNRYLIPRYIAETGNLPNGYEEAVRIPGYGFSYAFQPILPYMLQGYAMRFAGLFTDSPTAMLYTARAVNLVLGLAMAWVVLLLSGKWFRDRRARWVFAFLATFLPQGIFLHTYVNTDSCCMLSIALMLYGLTLGLESGFSRTSSLIMSTGIILCALSYYNAYGYILSCILLFTAFHLTGSGRNIRFDVKNFMKKGVFISLIVLAGIAWWFIRSAILYEGDFLGLQTRNHCAALYSAPEYDPELCLTWKKQGYSLWDMLRKSDFINLSILSFIGIFGPMSIVTSVWVYRFYKTLFFLGTASCLFLGRRSRTSVPSAGKNRDGLRIFYHINMVFCMVMPLCLSLVYSYSTDFQPQGRSLLPALLPLCYYTVRGLEKLLRLLLRKCPEKTLQDACSCIALLCCLLITGMLLLTVYGYAFPYYAANPVALSAFLP